VASIGVWNVLLAARGAWILLETSGSPYISYLYGRAPGSGESSVKVTAVHKTKQGGYEERLRSSCVPARQSDEVSVRLDSVCVCVCVCEQWVGTAEK
jgi:hypothetical protein